MFDFPPMLPQEHIFPDPREESSRDGLIAWGGDLHPDRVLEGYRVGVFPWFNPREPILWWSPDPRTVLYTDSFKLSKSLRRVLRNSQYEVTFDRAFDRVIENCAIRLREQESSFKEVETWIGEDIKSAYKTLHKMGYAHSVEVWIDGVLAGGLYGVALGGAFFGESMFSLKSNSSKIALKAISDVLNKRGYDFIDCQVKTNHLISLGAVEISRARFLEELEEALSKRDDDVGSWSNLKWEYEDGR